MIFIFDIILNILEIGLIYSLIIVAVNFSSNIIKFDDLSTEGSFAFGGALTAILIQNNVPSLLAIILALFTGGISGFLTGLLHTKLKLNNLISGIVVNAALFSINLKIAGTSITLSQTKTILDSINHPLIKPLNHLIILFLISISIFLIINWFLKTEIGFLIKALGNNSQILTLLGKNISFYKIFGLFISNSITALAGALFVIHTGFYSISGSIGSLAIALAGLIIGKAIFKNDLLSFIVGAILYQAIIATTIELEFDPLWNKLITAVLIIFLIAIQKQKFFLETER